MIDLMNRVGKELSDIGTVEQAPRMMGRTLFMLMYPTQRKTEGAKNS